MDRSGFDDKSAPFQGEANGFAGRGLLGGNPGHLHTGRSQEVQAIDKIGPVVALTNSAGGWRALLSAQKAKGDNMKGIVAYETPGFVFPEGEGAEPKPSVPFGPNSMPLAEFMKLTKFPIQMVCSATTPTRVPSGPPRSTSHGPFAVSSIVTEEIAGGKRRDR